MKAAPRYQQTHLPDSCQDLGDGDRSPPMGFVPKEPAARLRVRKEARVGHGASHAAALLEQRIHACRCCAGTPQIPYAWEAKALYIGDRTRVCRRW